MTRRFVQLVTGIFEQRSLLLSTIAESSAFAGTDSSKATQVRPIIRDARISLNDMFYPLLQELIAELPNEVLYLTLDETSHHISAVLSLGEGGRTVTEHRHGIDMSCNKVRADAGRCRARLPNAVELCFVA